MSCIKCTFIALILYKIGCDHILFKIAKYIAALTCKLLHSPMQKGKR